LQRDGASYQPKIWVRIDIPSGIVRIVDNGVGMNIVQSTVVSRGDEAIVSLAST
jgi:hypothetical protein